MTIETILYFPSFLNKKSSFPLFFLLFYFFLFSWMILPSWINMCNFCLCLTFCQVTGWEDTSPEKPLKCLQKATLKIVSRKSCDKHYASDPKTTNNMLCAPGKSKWYLRDTCEVRSKVTKGGTYIEQWFPFHRERSNVRHLRRLIIF